MSTQNKYIFIFKLNNVKNILFWFQYKFRVRLTECTHDSPRNGGRKWSDRKAQKQNTHIKAKPTTNAKTIWFRHFFSFEFQSEMTVGREWRRPWLHPTRCVSRVKYTGDEIQTHVSIACRRTHELSIVRMYIGRGVNVTLIVCGRCLLLLTPSNIQMLKDSKEREKRHQDKGINLFWLLLFHVSLFI